MEYLVPDKCVALKVLFLCPIHAFKYTSMSTNVNSASKEVAMNSNLIISKPLYACPYGQANTSLKDGKAKVSTLLDNGSEILMMPK